MGPAEQQSWKDEALTFLLQAIAGDVLLRQQLVFKGARILYLGLGTPGRVSLDLDATLQFEGPIVTPEIVASELEQALERVLRTAIRDDDPVRYRLQRVRVTPDPIRSHPRGWQGYDAIINLDDLRRQGSGRFCSRHQRGVPRLMPLIEPLGSRTWSTSSRSCSTTRTMTARSGTASRKNS